MIAWVSAWPRSRNPLRPCRRGTHRGHPCESLGDRPFPRTRVSQAALLRDLREGATEAPATTVDVSRLSSGRRPRAPVDDSAALALPLAAAVSGGAGRTCASASRSSLAGVAAAA